MPPPDPALLDDLRRRIERLERAPAAPAKPVAGIPLGLAAIDGALPWGGLPRGTLNEVLAGSAPSAVPSAVPTAVPTPALSSAAGFCAALLGRAAGAQGTAAATVLWCRPGNGAHGSGLYGPGLASFGLDPGRLIVVSGRAGRDVLWAMEEGLRSGTPAAVMGETGGGEAGAVSMTALRRLQLAAETGGVMALLLRPGSARAIPSPAATRWWVAAEPDAADTPFLGPPRWRLDLLRCRGGRPGSWLVEWLDQPGNKAANDDRHPRPHFGPPPRPSPCLSARKTGDFSIVAEVRDRPAGPQSGGLAHPARRWAHPTAGYRSQRR